MAQKRGSRGRPPGSVREVKGRSLSKAWLARISLPDGSRPSEYFRTEAEGWEWCAQMLLDAKRGRVVHDSAMPTGTLLDEWLETVAARRVSENTLEGYRVEVKRLKPWIGAIKLRDLKRQHIEKTFAGFDKGDDDQKPLARSTQGLTFRVLKMALDYGVDCDLLARHPMYRMAAPKADGPKGIVLTMEQCQAVFAATRGTRWYALFAVLATTGLRISEALGLTWEDVDLATGVIRVRQQSLWLRQQRVASLMPLKTRSSYRTVRVPPEVVDALRAHRVIMEGVEARARARGEWHDAPTIFCSVTGQLLVQANVAYVMQRLREPLGLPARASFHTFRHTIATMLHHSGHPLRATQGLLGHSAQATTVRVYTHPVTDSINQIADSMGKALFDTIDAEFVEDV